MSVFATIPAHPFVTLSIGSRIGVYEVIAKLGQGGMGEVYRARDTRLEREVALKVLPPSVAGDTDRIMRFEREAKTIEDAISQALADGYGTADLKSQPRQVSTTDLGDVVRRFVAES